MGQITYCVHWSSLILIRNKCLKIFFYEDLILKILGKNESLKGKLEAIIDVFICVILEKIGWRGHDIFVTSLKTSHYVHCPYKEKMTLWHLYVCYSTSIPGKGVVNIKFFVTSFMAYPLCYSSSMSDKSWNAWSHGQTSMNGRSHSHTNVLNKEAFFGPGRIIWSKFLKRRNQKVEKRLHSFILDLFGPLFRLLEFSIPSCWKTQLIYFVIIFYLLYIIVLYYT